MSSPAAPRSRTSSTKLRGYWWHRVRVGDRAYVKAKWRAIGRSGEVRGLHTIIDARPLR